MLLRFYICCFLLVVASLPAHAQSDPACLSQDSVPEMADNPSHGWLSREAPEAVKARFEKRADNDKRHWDGDTLVISCAVGGPPAYDMPAVRVEGMGAGVSTATGDKAYYSDLARRTGHTQQEADVLYNKYAQLHGAYFRTVPDGRGSQASEETVILKRHEKQLGIEPPAAPSGPSGDSKQRGAELKKKMEAAKKRGDMNEMMRLAGEAQQLSAPAAAGAAAVMKKTDQQTWSLLESSFPELIQAAYRTRITRLTCPCLQCEWPQ